MTNNPVYLAGTTRTAFGKFGGGYIDASVTDMATPVVKTVLERTGIAADTVDHLVFGNVMATTYTAPWAARVTALNAGIPSSVSSMMVNRACGTGLQAIVSAAEQIILDQSQVAIAAGAEALSHAPHVMYTRWGVKRGVPKIEDMLEWTYRDPFGNLMGDTAERLAGVGKITRDEQDEYTASSQARTEAARLAGYFDHEIIEVLGVSADELPRPTVGMEQLSRLKPAFSPEGTVTAASSTAITDGGAAIAVFSAAAAERYGVDPDGRIVDWSVVGVEPELMGRGPVPATQAVLARTGLAVADIDVFEINEAFAVVPVYATQQLKLDPELTNPNGGALAIGHPPGATGIRMVGSALAHLQRTGGRYGVVTMCLGGGMGMAMIVENLRRN